MRIARDLTELAAPGPGSVVSIGFYDGVHLGHQALISSVLDRAAAAGLTTTVVTFDRHPAQVLRPESAPLLLCDLDQKLERLGETGIDQTLVVHFDEERARETAEHFVRDVLVGGLGAKVVVVGEDFHFGHRRSGNVAMLQEMGAELGFEVIGHHLVGLDWTDARPELQVSSTAIRRALVEGRLDDANAMLGRPHEMRGPVVDGDKRGRTIGFPTANVAIRSEILLPSDGIYAGHLERPTGERLPSAIYLGTRPTFYDDQPASLLEVHCLDWEGDLYGEDVRVHFEHRLRGDRKFDTIEELTAQLAIDCQASSELLRPR
ncbi:MAG TPA: bifunctional riboflavin kinase/FAD synthetase [Microthrixaceae bacterium]|jgi:riboflavin kinase/FMN adenylyltransferase|nr:bifunctional riboflavin kinase/FAD synthetase [Microthrixaceae bacterium]HQF95393.1 bifunctional riboflavin kinase/FAD synthetase [Microthrixaceae bacterium]